jgi:hypothetical protein
LNSKVHFVANLLNVGNSNKKETKNTLYSQNDAMPIT